MNSGERTAGPPLSPCPSQRPFLYSGSGEQGSGRASHSRAGDHANRVMEGWAIDLGNSNTRVARWDPETSSPTLLELPNICREPGGSEPLAAPRLVPSATEIIRNPTWIARLGRSPFISKRWLIGNLAQIGQTRPGAQHRFLTRPGFVRAFKPYLGRESVRTLTRIGDRSYSAREVARLFMRELLAEIKETTGERIRDLVLTTPVEAYETYRAELSGIARQLGVKEPPLHRRTGRGRARLRIGTRSRTPHSRDRLRSRHTRPRPGVVLGPGGGRRERRGLIAKRGESLGRQARRPVVARGLVEVHSDTISSRTTAREMPSSGVNSCSPRPGA